MRPLKSDLIKLSEKFLPKKVKFFGKINIADIPSHIINSDCLILPSKFDGFGAVAVEALMVGTPVICSSVCGVVEVIRSSGACDVFSVDNHKELSNKLKLKMQKGKVSIESRMKLAKWAECLNAKSGARYLEYILHNPYEISASPPWQKF